MVSFRTSPWEGKGFVYYVKDTIQNRPAMAAVAIFYTIVFPAFYWYQEQYKDQMHLENARYRPRYVVYRDDDPRVKDVIRLDENGKRIYLTPVQQQ